jgi:hypothetical protein
VKHQPGPVPDTELAGGWTYLETVDEASSTIRVRGRVGRLGADLLRGTVEELSRRGHRDITVTVEDAQEVDSSARGVLLEMATVLAARDGRLTVQWSPAHDDSATVQKRGAPL